MFGESIRAIRNPPRLNASTHREKEDRKGTPVGPLAQHALGTVMSAPRGAGASRVPPGRVLSSSCSTKKKKHRDI